MKIIKKIWKNCTNGMSDKQSKTSKISKNSFRETLAKTQGAPYERLMIDTGRYFLQESFAIVKTIEAVCLEPKTRAIAGKILKITLCNVAPLVFIQYLNDQGQEKGTTFLDNHPDWDLSTISLPLAMGLGSIIVAAVTVKTRIKLLIETAFIMIETADTLRPAEDNVRPSEQSAHPCKQDKCSMLRHLQGSLRGIIAYEATAGMLAVIYPFINLLPLVGNFLSLGLRIHHESRYTVTTILALKGICNRHQEVYMTEYPELTISFTLMQLVLLTASSHFIERATGIPRGYYQPTLQTFLLVAQMNMAAKMDLPRPVVESSRWTLDPISLYTRVVGFLFDNFLRGFKQNITSFIMKHSDTIDWPKTLKRLIKISNHQMVFALKLLLLPKMLHSMQAFITHEFIPGKSLREKLILSLVSLVQQIDSWPVQAATACPKLTANIIHLAGYGVSPTMIEFGLELLSNKKVRFQLKRALEALHQMHAINLSIAKGPEFLEVPHYSSCLRRSVGPAEQKQEEEEKSEETRASLSEKHNTKETQGEEKRAERTIEEAPAFSRTDPPVLNKGMLKGEQISHTRFNHDDFRKAQQNPMRAAWNKPHNVQKKPLEQKPNNMSATTTLSSTPVIKLNTTRMTYSAQDTTTVNLRQTSTHRFFSNKQSITRIHPTVTSVMDKKDLSGNSHKSVM